MNNLRTLKDGAPVAVLIGEQSCLAKVVNVTPKFIKIRIDFEGLYNRETGEGPLGHLSAEHEHLSPLLNELENETGRQLL